MQCPSFGFQSNKWTLGVALKVMRMRTDFDRVRVQWLMRAVPRNLHPSTFSSVHSAPEVNDG